MEPATHAEFTFATTYGFTSTCGFAASSSSALPPTPPQPQPALIGSYDGSSRLGGSPTSALNVSPNCAANVGWKALLESSKAAGPLIGTKSMVRGAACFSLGSYQKL